MQRLFRRRVFWALLAIVSLLFVVVAYGMGRARSIVESKIEKRLGVETHIGAVVPLFGSVSLRDMRFGGSDESFSGSVASYQRPRIAVAVARSRCGRCSVVGDERRRYPHQYKTRMKSRASWRK